jgi:hypothetical protein
MPSFFRELRRRSKASFQTDQSSSNGSQESSGHSTLPSSKSSSTLSSLFRSSAIGTTKPSSNLQGPPSVANDLPNSTHARPPMPQVNRYSINVRMLGSRCMTRANMTSQTLSPAVNGRPKSLASHSSPLAPHVLSVSDNSWV